MREILKNVSLDYRWCRWEKSVIYQAEFLSRDMEMANLSSLFLFDRTKDCASIGFILEEIHR